MSTPTAPFKDREVIIPVAALSSKIKAVPSYKPSRFNAHTDSPDGKLLLYNAFTGHSCAIPEKHAADAQAYLNATGFTGELSKVGQYLLLKGYIVESEVDESARWDIRYGMWQYRQDCLELILLSSEDCNFRCVYCSQQFKRGSMQPPVRAGVRNLVASRLRHLTSLEVSWFGGEPLLGYDAIEELAPHFQELAASQNISYRSGMTTNGHLLTPERSRKLVSWGVSHFQVTLDGKAADHDAHRPLEAGGATFDVILANLHAMKSIEGNFEVAIRCNFDHTNVSSILELINNLKELAAGDERFVLRFRPVGKWGGPNDDQLDVCGVRESARQSLLLNTAAIREGIHTEAIDSGLTPGPASTCYAARPYSLVVGADGKIMKCTVVLDTDERNVVGTLSQDGHIDFNEDRFAMWTRPYYRTDTMCSKCFFVPVCQGTICPLPRITVGERPCPSQKLEIQQTLKDVHYFKELQQASLSTNKSQEKGGGLHGGC
jgi:uncharacterized protein